MSKSNPDGSPVVLLVEDEPLIRMTAADHLEEAGFHVLEAANADVALAALEARSYEIEVLFTDIDMPGSMNGLQLAESVHARWPHIALLISSGYHRPHPHELPDHGQFLPKPYDADELAQKLREQIANH